MTALQTRNIAPTSKSVPSVDESDATLLNRFAKHRSEAAFEILMRRHGPMVIGVCHRVLNNWQEAEDACQATFLLLVQKGRSLRRPERLANWLYGVAYRVATRAKTKAARSGRCGILFADPPVADGDAELDWCELCAVLDEEINRLPEEHRLPLILCYLEGKTHVEAARQLGWASGSMSRRLSRARDTLRKRLARRDLSFSAPLIDRALCKIASGTTLPESLIDCTRRAARAIICDNAAVSEVVALSVAEQAADMNRTILVRRLAAVLLLSLLLMLGVTGKKPSDLENLLPLSSARGAIFGREVDNRPGVSATVTVHALARPLVASDRQGGKLQLTHRRKSSGCGAPD